MTEQSSLFADSLPTTPSQKDLLRFNGRLICKVLAQTARRAGYQSSDFNIVVEFDNAKSQAPAFRAMVLMPATSALTLADCRELEYTAIIELEIRFDIRLSGVFWGMGGDAADRATSSVELGDAGVSTRPQPIETSSYGALSRTAYPAPVRLSSPPSDGGLAMNTDREATPSELREFAQAMDAAFQKPMAIDKTHP